MGLFLTDVQLLLQMRIAMKKMQRNFGEVATLGRQWMLADTKDVGRALRASALDQPAVDRYLSSAHLYADDLLQLLGATRVDAIDYSDYEGAGIVLDLNVPIDEGHRQRFDVVYDGGTLEHVFNFPVAIANCMRMVRSNGWLVLHTPANNLCGHGFYQFSPELFYRVFAAENGFRVAAMYFVEQFRAVGERGVFYKVPDPQLVQTRVQLDGGYPVYLIVVAQKLNDVEPFTKPPLQSDYFATWNASRNSTSPSSGLSRQKLLASFDRAMPRVAQAIRNVRNPLNNRRFYQAVQVPRID